MRMLYLEIKRVLGSRMTWVSLAVTTALSVIISFAVLSYPRHTSYDGNGHKVRLTGRAAISANKESMRPYEGEVTVEKLRLALGVFQDAYKEYGKDIPVKVLHEKIYPVDPFLNMISNVYPGDNYLDTLGRMDPGILTDFYSRRSEMLRSVLKEKFPKDARPREEALKLEKRVKTPFIFRPGYTRDAADNLQILLYIFVLICAAVVSPVFSAEYQNGSDDILRCTRHGRTKLALVKNLSALLIILAMFTVGTLTFVLIVDPAFGWESLRTSAQAMISPLSFAPFSIGQEQALTIAASLLSVLAVACLTLFLSSKCRNATTAMVIAVAFCLAPAFLHSLGRGNLVNILTYILPSGGTWMLNGFFYQLNGSVFINLGPLCIWSPYFIIGASLVEIPLFFFLAVRAYCRHQPA